MIKLPTRTTDASAMLIDNIFSNSQLIQMILLVFSFQTYQTTFHACLHLMTKWITKRIYIPKRKNIFVILIQIQNKIYLFNLIKNKDVINNLLEDDNIDPNINYNILKNILTECINE